MNTIERDTVIEEMAVAAWTFYADTCKRLGLNPHQHGEWIASNYLRALKSQPAQPDPRDEALRVARESIARIEQPLANIADVLSVNSAVKEANNGLHLLNKAIAAIDALIGDN